MNRPLEESKTLVPEGFDAICAGCRVPYTFKNAKAVKAEKWGRFCSNICANEKPSKWCPSCGHLLR